MRIGLAGALVNRLRGGAGARIHAGRGIGLAPRRMEQMRPRLVAADQHHDLTGAVSHGDAGSVITARAGDIERGFRCGQRKFDTEVTLCQDATAHRNLLYFRSRNARTFITVWSGCSSTIQWPEPVMIPPSTLVPTSRMIAAC